MSLDSANDKIEAGVALGLAWKGYISHAVIFTGLKWTRI